MEGDGSETGSDSGFSLTADLTVSGDGSNWAVDSVETPNNLTSLGIEADGSMVMESGTGASDSQCLVANGSETLTDMGGGPSDTADYDSTVHTEQSDYDQETTTLNQGEDGCVTDGTDNVAFGSTYSMTEWSGASGPSVSSGEDNSDRGLRGVKPWFRFSVRFALSTSD